MAHHPILYAHRGASAELPENTLPAFARALEVGATALELDVHLTADGHVVVSHDASGMRQAGVPVAIRRSTLPEVKAWDVGRTLRGRGVRLAAASHQIPTLDEVLEVFPEVPINVDVKQHDQRTVKAVVEVVRRRGAQREVLLTSFDQRTLCWIRGLGYEGATGLGQLEVAALLLVPEALLELRPLGGRAAQIPTHVGPVRLDTRALIDKAHRLGLVVHYWTINDPAEARRLLALGADGVMSDDPARVASAFI